jgi:hypothetical protein
LIFPNTSPREAGVNPFRVRAGTPRPDSRTPYSQRGTRRKIPRVHARLRIRNEGAASGQYVNIQRIKAHLGTRPFAAKELYHVDEGMFQRATAYNILSRLVYGNVLTRS